MADQLTFAILVSLMAGLGALLGVTGGTLLLRALEARRFAKSQKALLEVMLAPYATDHLEPKP